jgi:fused signal recognition particle receptor
MFEGLKDKLGQFSEEAEEDVVEEADGEAVDDDDTATADEDTVEASGETAGGEPEADPEASAPTETAAGDETVEDSTAAGSADTTAETPATASEETPSDGSGGAPADGQMDEAAGSAEAGAADDGDGTDGPAETDEQSRGLRERAKLFATGKTVIDEDDLAAHLEELEFALLGSDVEYEVTNEILDGVEQNLTGETRRRLSSTGNLVRDALREALYDVISVGQFDFDARIAEADSPVVIVFTGVNGVGKTTTIAKLAHYFEQRGLEAVLANGDTFRAGANEQLEQHARNLDKKVISHEQGSDPTAVIYDAVEYAKANDVDVVLGDTAGRLHTDDGLMDQLSKIERIIEPDMTLFVDQATAGQDAVNRASEFDAAAEVDGTVLTKVDADTQGGAAISIAHVTGKPILFLGTGQDYDDIEPFDPETIVDTLLGEEA